ncbi:MAG: LysM peptidoglycan-binding domain-containing protein, partial [Planctomycetota bacterium]
ELKIAVAAVCLLVLFAAVYLVIKLTGPNGEIVADQGEPGATEEIDGTEGDDPGSADGTIPVINDEPGDPFEAEPTVASSDAGSAWDDLFADGGDGSTMMQTPGGGEEPADTPDANIPPAPDTADGGAAADPDDARLASGGNIMPSTDDAGTDDAGTNNTAPDFTGSRTYIVESGDSFYTIARDQLGDANLYRAIERANPLIDPRKIRPGMEIKLPSPADLETANGTRATFTEADLTIDGHVVRAGETLSDIAFEHYGKAHLWRDIYAANRDKLESPNRLRVGLVLIIPDLPE